MAVLEAMASGLAVVVSDQSAYASLIENGPGLTYAAHDPRALAAALRQLVNDTLRLTMGRAGRDMVSRTRAWRISAESYVRIYMRSMRSSGA